MLPSLQLVLQTTLSSFATGYCSWQREGWGLELLWDRMKRYHKNPMPQTPVCCEGTVWGQGNAECQGRCELPGALSGQCDWTPCLSLDMLTSWLLSLQSGKETAEKSNHLLCIYLAQECFVWRQSNENHPKEVLCWWENYERPKKGVIKKFAVQVEL